MNKEGEKSIKGFSKLSKRGKIKWLVENFFKDPEVVMHELKSYWHKNEDKQKILDGISENTISNYPLPYGVAPNFLINDITYCIPMVTEESSVVAAASSAAKYWMDRGGFKAEVIDIEKLGHVHFFWKGSFAQLQGILPELKSFLKTSVEDLTKNMESRGGGIRDIWFKDFSSEMDDYFQLMCSFDTCQSMGANFINSILERFAEKLQEFIAARAEFRGRLAEVEILMSILSNLNPKCLVRAEVSCAIDDLTGNSETDPKVFAEKFSKAIRTAEIDPYRAATHNKGIFNGIDAVLIATANDFRAVESGGHAYASLNGSYRSLTHCEITDGTFRFWIEMPIGIGTIGGLTNLHPIAKRSLELLGNPTSKELMQIIASAGLAQNFAAIKSLVTTGIQKGHMRMHLGNILIKLEATELETEQALDHFQDKAISYSAVRGYLETSRSAEEITS